MKKNCAYTRKSLRKYLHGHLFKPEQIRVERHLRSCVMCYTEYQALKQAAETKQYLKDITPPEGIVQRVQASVSGLSKLKKILYRPLWLAGIITIIVLAFIYVLAPPRRDLEIENLEKSGSVGSALSSTAPASPVRAVDPAPVTAPATTVRPPASQPDEAVRILKPLPVTITVDNEKAAIRRINEVMRGHGELRKMRFSDTVREISGSLTSKELLTFFSLIESEGKISYSRKRLVAFPSSQPVPFVMNLKVAPQAIEKPSPPEQPVVPPADATASSQPATAPTQSAVP
jgi:hypothetical protein